MKMGSAVVVRFLTGAALLGILATAGCSNDAWAKMFQPSDQVATVPATTDQQAATQGTQIYFDISQVPGGAKHGDDPFWAVLAGGDAGTPAFASALGVSEGASGVQHAAATFLQSGFSIIITTGGTTPSLTGTAAATGTATQAPSQSGTQTPTQTVSPEMGIALPVAVALPGGVADSAAAASGTGAATMDKQASHTATNQVLETLASDATLRERFLEILTGTGEASTNGVP